MSRTAILVPSLGRPQHVKRTFGNIEANTPEPHDQLWCVTGEEYTSQLDELGVFFYIDDSNDPDRRYVTRMNKLIEAMRTGSLYGIEDRVYDYVFFGSDDVIHHPRWLRNALTVMESAENAQVVVVNDMRNPNGTQAVVRVDYLPLAVFDDPASAFHPGYQHNFADTEMFMTASERGVIYRAMDSHVEHLHPLFGRPGGRAWDKTYADAQSKWDQDASLFSERIAAMKKALHEEEPLPG